MASSGPWRSGVTPTSTTPQLAVIPVVHNSPPNASLWHHVCSDVIVDSGEGVEAVIVVKKGEVQATASDGSVKGNKHVYLPQAWRTHTTILTPLVAYSLQCCDRGQ